MGSIDIVGTGNTKIGNSTEVAGTVITNSKGPGILINRAVRAVIYNNTIDNSANSGVAMIVGADRTIVSYNWIRNGLSDGIYSDTGSTASVIEANFIYKNKNNAIKIAGANPTGSVNPNAGYVGANVTLAAGVCSDTVIIRNTIRSNGGASIYLETNYTNSIVGTKILGNTMMYNSKGVTAKGVTIGSGNGITNTYIFGNTDKDGLSQTILKAGAFGKALDPMNRLLFATPLQTAAVITGNISLSMVPKISLDTTVTWTAADINLFAKYLGISMDPTFQNGEVTITYLAQNGYIINLDWQLKYHLEDRKDEDGVQAHTDSASARAYFDSVLTAAEQSGVLYNLLQLSGSPTLESVSKATIHHKLKSDTSFPEHQKYVAYVNPLTRPIAAKPVQKPTPKPKAKPAKGGKGGKKGGKTFDFFMDAFQSVVAVVSRAFSVAF